jgi:hypothetical protein
VPANSDLHCIFAYILVLDALALCAAAFIYPLRSLSNDLLTLRAPRFFHPHPGLLYDFMSSTRLMEFSQLLSQMSAQIDLPCRMLVHAVYVSHYSSAIACSSPTRGSKKGLLNSWFCCWDFSLLPAHCLILFRVRRLMKLDFRPSFVITSFRACQIKRIQRPEPNACLSQWPDQVECTL